MTLLISALALFIVNVHIGTTHVQAYTLSNDSQQTQGLGSKDVNKNISEQFAITQNQSRDPISNTTAKNGNTGVQFGSNQDRTHVVLDSASISKSDPKAQFGSNQN